mgnify:CR=1 FL=1
MVDFNREDSGIESDQPNKTENSDEAEDESPIENNEDEDENREVKKKEENSADSNFDFVLPNFTFNHIIGKGINEFL